MQKVLATAGSIGLLLIAIAHTVGHFGPLPTDEPFERAWASMGEARLALGFGWRPSLVEVWQSQSLTMIVLVALLAVMNLVLLRLGLTTAQLRPVLLLTAGAAAGLAAVNLWYRVGMPAAFFSVVAALFLVAVFLPGAAGRPT